MAPGDVREGLGLQGRGARRHRPRVERDQLGGETVAPGAEEEEAEAGQVLTRIDELGHSSEIDNRQFEGERTAEKFVKHFSS